MTVELDRWAPPRVAQVEARLAACFADAWPPRLAEACRYPLATGGKRMRPLVCFAACEAVGGRVEDALDAAAALELLHTYSLVHDDLPAMDDDSERRGHPTVHVRYDEATAILVGDALLTEAFAVLADAGPRAAVLVRELARAGGAAGMIAGQAVDVGMDGPTGSAEALIRLHRGKTGALLRAAARMGAIAGGADAHALEILSEYGDALGLAFQVHDDLLDADQDADPAGPPSFVKLLGPEGTAAEAHRQAERAIAAARRLPAPDALVALARFTVERRV